MAADGQRNDPRCTSPVRRLQTYMLKPASDVIDVWMLISDVIDVTDVNTLTANSNKVELPGL